MCNAQVNDNVDNKQGTLFDPLTKTYNRDYFDRNHMKMRRNAILSNKRIGILVIEFNNLEPAFADKMLLRTAEMIKRNSAMDDVLFRWGEAQLLLLMPRESALYLLGKAEDIWGCIDKTFSEEMVNGSCHVGGVYHLNNETLDESVVRAYHKLDEIKSTGSLNYGVDVL